MEPSSNSPAQAPPTPPPPRRRPLAGLGVLARFGSRHPWLRHLGLGVADLILLLITLRLAYWVALMVNPRELAVRQMFSMHKYQIQFYYVAPCLILFRMILLQLLGLYRGFTRYTGLYEVSTIMAACLAGTMGLVIFNIVSDYIPDLGWYKGHYPIHASGEHILRVPWSIVFIDAMLSISLLSGVRVGRRMLAERFFHVGRAAGRRRVLIIGANDAGEQVARDLLRSQRDRFKLAAFLDPNPKLKGRRIHGIPVMGGLERLDAMTRRFRIDMVIIALTRPDPALMRRLVDQCREARLEFKIIPDLDSVMAGRIQISQLRPVEIEDLLGRPPIVLDVQPERSCLTGRCVLVTGAGGSIGSELCRQALVHRPASLILLGRGENSVYEIHHELAPRAQALGVPLEPRIGDVRDPSLIESLFKEHCPQVILHAAAHKHVHFMELQPAEAIKNNVTGTRLLAQAAMAAKAERFILISTDKAVRPTGIMGASKRVAEMIVSALNAEGDTRFIAVRFGNVLGSRGSVIPLFRRQIDGGGPVTVTHPEVTRYFMTIPEAVSLVLEAGASGQGGEVFLLDMGQPIRILDLARNLITLSGLEPGRDIEIQFTGMRPGEKLYEELITADQNYLETGHNKILRCNQPALAWPGLSEQIARLEDAALAGGREAIIAILRRLISDYQPPATQ